MERLKIAALCSSTREALVAMGQFCVSVVDVFTESTRGKMSRRELHLYTHAVPRSTWYPGLCGLFLQLSVDL